jgi:CheY-like chemotaxis protein
MLYHTPPLGTPTMSRRRSVILVVDDEEKILTLIGEQLEGEGYDVILASSGDDAFDILKGTSRIDLIVTDVRMPGVMNGFDLIERATAGRPDLRTIVMSGYSGESARAGLADCFLRKPFTFVSLEREVKALLAA